MDNDQQRDTEEENFNRREAFTEVAEAAITNIADQATGDPGAPEWHEARAHEAIERGETALAVAHLQLASALDDAIAERARRFRLARGLPPTPTPRELRNLWDMLDKGSPSPTGRDARLIPFRGATRAEEPAGTREACRCAYRAPELGPHPLCGVHGPAWASPADLLACTTCAGRVMNVPGKGWRHLDGNGQPMDAIDGHPVTMAG